MKILMVNDLLQGGGVERLLQDLVWRFHDKYEVSVLTDKKDIDYKRLLPENVKYFYQIEKEYPVGRNKIERRLNWHKRNKDKAVLKKEIEKEKYDVMLCLKEGWIMMMAMDYGSNIPKRIAWNHTDYKASYYTKDWYKTKEAEVDFMKKFDNIVGVSNMITQNIASVIGNPGNLVVKYNPLNYDYINEKKDEEINDVVRSERPLFVSVGRLNIQKGYDNLMEVCALLNDEGYEYDVWIIGGGESWNNYQVLHDLEEQIRKYDLKNVYLLGPRDNPYKYIKMADWFLSSSRYEGYSYVSQEAAIVGTPVLLTECSGVKELIDANHNGIMMENSIRGLYKGMMEAISNPDLAKKYRAEAIVYGKEYYEDSRYDEIEKLFME